MELTVEFGPVLSNTPRSLPATTYRCLRLLIHRLSLPLFIPLRPLQILAIVDDHEVIFLHPQEKRHALIRWHDFQTQCRDNLEAPVAFMSTRYYPDDDQWEFRLPVEFDHALSIFGQNHLPPISPSTPSLLIHPHKD